MKKYKKLITIILAIAGTAAFGQFIIEEAIQNYGFGVSMLIMNKLYRNSLNKAEYVKSQLDGYQNFHNVCQRIMNFLYVGNPLTAIWFHQYMISDQRKIDQYTKLVKEEIFYLKTRQERWQKSAKERYLKNEDKKHIQEILPMASVD